MDIESSGHLFRQGHQRDLTQVPGFSEKAFYGRNPIKIAAPKRTKPLLIRGHALSEGKRLDLCRLGDQSARSETIHSPVSKRNQGARRVSVNDVGALIDDGRLL